MTDIIINRKMKMNNINEVHDAFTRAVALKAGRHLFTIPWLVEGNAVGGDEPTPSAVGDDDIFQTVWFKMVAGRGHATMHTGQSGAEGEAFFSDPYSRAYGGRGVVGPGLDMFVGVYVGNSLDDLTELASATHTTFGDLVEFQVPDDNTVLWIQVGTLARSTGEAYLFYDVEPPPANDEPDGNGGNGTPPPIGGGSGSNSFNGCVYYDNPSDRPTVCGTIHKSAWYAWTAPSDGTLEFQANSTGGDCIIGVFSEDFLTEITCATGAPAVASFAVTEGTVYKIGFGFVSAFVCGVVNFNWHFEGEGNPADGYYVRFEAEFDANYVSYTTNGNVSFLPFLFEYDSVTDFFGQAIFPVRHRIAGVDQDYFTWGVNYVDNFPEGYRFGDPIVSGHTYVVEFHQEHGAPGTGKVTARIDGVEFGPWDASDDYFVALPDRIYFGQYDVIPNARGVVTLDNLTVGLSDWGTDEVFSADFASGIVPPFDALIDTASEVTNPSGTMVITLPGSGSSDEGYAQVDT